MHSREELLSDPVKREVKEYWDYSSKIYDKSPGTGTEEEERLWKEELTKAIGSVPLEVLDVGTGTGYMALLLAELGHQVTGIDFSDQMLAVARQKTAAWREKVKLFQGDVEQLPFGNGSFDCVNARFVLWTLPDPEKAIREWIRVLKPGGRAVIIDGLWETKGILQHIAHFNMKVYWLLKSGHFFRYRYKKDLSHQLPHPKGVTMEEIRRYMLNAGLTDISVTDLEPLRKARRNHLPWYVKSVSDHPTYLLTGKTAQP
jgi:ubiquinone/menaquinone biosynthesis C-methylase UbiE